MVIKVSRALISTYDKTGLPDLASFFQDNGVSIVSTGGTSKFLEKINVKHQYIEELTHFPEILGGRVKTLHPAVHAGILVEPDRQEHVNQIETLGIQPFQLVIVNLYPFQEVVRRGCDEKEAIENVDIGGPTMVRASAKNHRNVCVVMDPADYHDLIKILQEHGGIPIEFSRKMALKAFSCTASYDAAIVEYFSGRWNADQFPEFMAMNLQRVNKLRYGENDHQVAALYRFGNADRGFPEMSKLQGKELSYNNIMDIDAAWRCCSSFQGPTAVVVKHTNPCGIGKGSNVKEAFERAWECDSKSAFGGIIALNETCTGDLAEMIKKNFVEVVIAPSFSDDSIEAFSKKKNLRLITLPRLESRELYDFRRVWGGMLVQSWDTGDPGDRSWKTVTKLEPTKEELEMLRFAWTTVQHVKSNAIVFCNAVQTVGIGAGQMSRVDSVEIAMNKAQLPLDGTVVASDAFFPFRDSIDTIASAGATAVIQPGGSIRDEEVIQAADERGLKMIFTGTRHFRH